MGSRFWPVEKCLKTGPAACENFLSAKTAGHPTGQLRKAGREAVSLCGVKEVPSIPHGLPVTTWLPQRRGPRG